MSRGWAGKERHLMGVLCNLRTRSFAIIVLVKVRQQRIFCGRFLTSKFRQAVVSLPRTAQRKSLLKPLCACSYNSHVAALQVHCASVFPYSELAETSERQRRPHKHNRNEPLNFCAALQVQRIRCSIFDFLFSVCVCTVLNMSALCLVLYHHTPGLRRIGPTALNELNASCRRCRHRLQTTTSCNRRYFFFRLRKAVMVIGVLHREFCFLRPAMLKYSRIRQRPPFWKLRPAVGKPSGFYGLTAFEVTRNTGLEYLQQVKGRAHQAAFTGWFKIPVTLRFVI